jgi:Flp pilus assembly protein TadB
MGRSSERAYTRGMNRAGAWPFIVSFGVMLLALKLMRWRDEDIWWVGPIGIALVAWVVFRLWRRARLRTQDRQHR